jgi:hypothetical protein
MLEGTAEVVMQTTDKATAIWLRCTSRSIPNNSSVWVTPVEAQVVMHKATCDSSSNIKEEAADEAHSNSQCRMHNLYNPPCHIGQETNSKDIPLLPKTKCIKTVELVLQQGTDREVQF